MFLLGFWGAAFSSVLGVYHGVPFLFDDMLHVWRRQPADGQQGRAYRAWAVYLDAGGDLGAAGPAPGVAGVRLHRRRVALLPVRDLDAALAEQLEPHGRARVRNGRMVNTVLGTALLLYVFLAVRSAHRVGGGRSRREQRRDGGGIGRLGQVRVEARGAARGGDPPPAPSR